MQSKIVTLIITLLISTLSFAAPPGLQKKGVTSVPSWLGKNPPGWDQGLKKGWNKNRDWRFDKKSNLWENKDWHWDNKGKVWKQGKKW